MGPGQLALIQNGEINENIIAAPDTKGRTDAKGIFELPASKQAGMILVLDKTGYAMRKTADHDPDEPLRIAAWANVEGVVKAGEKGEGGASVMLTPVESRDRNDTGPQVQFRGVAGGPHRRYVRL